MAITTSGARLTQLHRVAQARLAAQTAALSLQLWEILDLTRLDATSAPWLVAMNQMVQNQRAKSAELAAIYLVQFREQELIGAMSKEVHRSFIPPQIGPGPAEQVYTALTVTGPVAMKRAMGNGATLAAASDKASAMAAGSAMRMSLEGGRQTIVETVAADPLALGWARIASPGACSFCQMLADRGAVYSENTVDFEAHDRCTCSAEPAYA